VNISLQVPKQVLKPARALLFIAATVIILCCILALRSRAFAIKAGGRSMSLTISSSAFTNGGTIAKKFTCDGADVSPPLTWTDPPAGTKAFALLVDDPDAPVGNWNHWVIWNLPANLRSLPEGVSKTTHLPDGSEQGQNDFHKPGYNGPCPPAGKPHRYFFKLFALDTKVSLKSEAGKPELEAAMKGHTQATAELMGTYKR
jgi:Raf kinase inhibitor-like YbhB/YbcL family protein